MEGQVEVHFTVLCDNDFYKEIPLHELLQSEKVNKAIKSEYGEGSRNLSISTNQIETSVILGSDKKVHTHTIDKKDIQDIIELTEEYARSQKLLKTNCSSIELINFTTLSN